MRNQLFLIMLSFKEKNLDFKFIMIDADEGRDVSVVRK